MEIDLHPELYKHYHLRAVPEKYRDQVDVRAFGTGERIVFLPYTREVFAATQHWTEAHRLFPERPESLRGYDEAALVLSGWAGARAVLLDAAEEARTMVAAVRHDPGAFGQVRPVLADVRVRSRTGFLAHAPRSVQINDFIRK